ncbi:MAG TPA: cysteine--1-D-myo-inosityl 2-amino-2-deoxy-alpha-D-glucopyranoside ligase [Propionibacteriaceae bacterium]|nr:cysteine--1-D-myo-inosityl 2-amino-2-deoxy-alpha-D-glucopyranoside ligase [Propionibacteriaceae bacterium]
MQAWTVPSVPFLRPADARPPLQLFDTASQQLVDIGPRQGTARMYVCGITPYDATHVGHANTYVVFDLLHRLWLDRGLEVSYVQNVTDVDDPLLERAAAIGVAWQALAEEETELFRNDMTALNVLPPQHYVGAIESMPLITGMIEQLQERGSVYPVDDPEFPDLYFAQAGDSQFGSLSHLDEAAAVSLFAKRGGDPERPGKKAPLDCLVWRLSRPGEPSWESPFGRGRPGWHVECTAIALEMLGTNFDVQGGGTDLIFPHHEMSAAEGRVATDRPFAKAYVHSGMVGLGGAKMSKSKGNLILVSELRESGVDPMAIRLALLDHHFRDDWDWTDELLASATERLDRWQEAVRLDAGVSASETIASMRSALDHNLNSPAALAAVDAWAGASTAVDADDVDAPALIVQACDALLGVRL